MPVYAFRCTHEDGGSYRKEVFRGLTEEGSCPSPSCWCGQVMKRDFRSEGAQITPSPMHTRDEWKDTYWDSAEGRKESDRLYNDSWKRDPEGNRIEGMKTVGENAD